MIGLTHNQRAVLEALVACHVEGRSLSCAGAARAMGSKRRWAGHYVLNLLVERGVVTRGQGGTYLPTPEAVRAFAQPQLVRGEDIRIAGQRYMAFKMQGGA